MNKKEEQDIFILSAAVADFTPVNRADQKIIKKDGEVPSIDLKRTQDILSSLGKDHRKDQYICGFAMETEDLLKNAGEKLKKKKADMICANSLREEGAGFGTDTNRITLVKKGSNKELPLLSKREVSDLILDEIMADING